MCERKGSAHEKRIPRGQGKIGLPGDRPQDPEKPRVAPATSLAVCVAQEETCRHRQEFTIIDEAYIPFLPPVRATLLPVSPVEHIWESIRENWFRNEVFNTMTGAENQLEKALATLEGDP